MSNSIELPTTSGCKKQYTCTLAGSAEIRGDHIATLMLPRYIQGEWKLPSSSTWQGIALVQSFLFTSANEVYDLRFSTTAGPDSSAQLLIKYTVGAIYAPAWAAIDDVITATRIDDPCCNITEGTVLSNSFTGAGGSAPYLAAGVDAQWSYISAGTGCIVVTGSGATDAQGQYRANFTTDCGTGVTYSNTDTRSGTATGTVTLTWAGGIKPYDWTNKAFTISRTLSASVNDGTWPTIAGNVTVTQTASCTVTVSKIAGTDDIAVHLDTSTASVTSSSVNSGAPPEINGASNPEYLPTYTPVPVSANIPCSNCVLVFTPGMVLTAGGSISHLHPAAGMSVTCVIKTT